MWKVFGGIAYAFVAWQVINLGPVDLMTEPCKGELTNFTASNEAIRRGVVVNGVQLSPTKYFAPRAAFEKRCKVVLSPAQPVLV